MNTLKLAVLLIFLGCKAMCYAQTNSIISKADSIWMIWQDGQKHDTIRLKAIDDFIWEYVIFNNPDSAFSLAKKQLDFAIAKNLKLQQASAMNTMGVTYSLKGDNKTAAHYLNLVLEIYKEINYLIGVASVNNNLGALFYDQGKFDLAIEYYTKSNIAYVNLKNKGGESATLNNLGTVYLDKGEFSKSHDCFKRSLSIANELNNHQYISTCFNNLGMIYKNQGNYLVSLENYTKSLKLAIDINDKYGEAHCQNNMGLVYMKLGDLTKAANCFNQSLKIRTELDEKTTMSYALNNLGQIHLLQGDLDSSFIYFTKSLNLSEEVADLKNVAYTLGNLGNLFLLKKDFQKSLDYNNQALNIALKAGLDMASRNDVITIYKIYIQTDSVNNAFNYINKLLLFREGNLQKNYFTLSEEEKVHYFATMEEDYGLYHDFALNFQNLNNSNKFENLIDNSYNIAIQNKGLSLKSSTALRKAVQNSKDTTLINLYDNWLLLKKKIATTNENESSYKDMMSNANEMERELVKKINLFNDFDKVKNLKWQDVQAGLKLNEAAIEFIHFKSEIDTTYPIIYAALIIKKDSQHPEMVKLCSEAELKEILGVFQGNDIGFVKKVYGTNSKAEKALYEKIWQPLEKHLGGVQTIYYSPSGLLHKVSFAAIRKENNIFLCDNYQLNQQSSTGKVALPTNALYDTKDEFLVIGGVQYNTDKTKKEVWNYLPGTLNETDNIQSFLEKKKHSVNFLAANDANEANFKTQAQKATVLHISTHGFFYPDPEQVREEVKKNEGNEENIIFRGTEVLDSAERSSSLYANWSFVINKNPLMRSGLVLAGANDVWQRNALEEGEDGILTAQEVSNLDLRNTKLVVLSACETGLGDIKGSEGVFGLQRAFKMAGAEFLIMSLWQVPDKETAEFMELFYKNLVKVKDIPKAFNLTQQVMRKKYDPYYWAAFVLIN